VPAATGIRVARASGMMRLTGFKALTFDVYGTLIDWETGIADALAPLASRSPVKLTRDQILEAHACHEARLQRLTPAKRYRDLLAVVHRRLAEDWQVAADWEDCLAYGRSVGDWPAFADSAPALAALKRHFALIVLSNVDNKSFAASARKLGVPFDAVFTAEDIGSYKPSARNFDHMLAELARRGIDRGDILHTAESLFHDHAPARRAGLATCRIFRRHGQPGFGATMEPDEMVDVDVTFNSMAELAAAVEAESTA
jgi:2-haloalkanoic acid dehalogenase type II